MSEKNKSKVKCTRNAFPILQFGNLLYSQFKILLFNQYLLMDINAFQSNLFTRCTTCDKLDRELHKQLNPEKKRDIFIKKQEHLHRQMYVSTSYLNVALITKNQLY